MGPRPFVHSHYRAAPRVWVGPNSTSEMCCYFPPVRSRAMFDEVDALPGAQPRLSIQDGNGQTDRHQRRLDMRGHIVRTLICMGEIRHPGVVGGRHQPVEIGREVALHLGIGVLRDQQAGGGVANEQGQEPIALWGGPLRDLARDLVQAGTGGVD